MSIEALNWAFDFGAKNASEKAVLLALANYAGGDGRCHPGQESIAKKASCSDRTVRTVLADLEARGIIAREERRRKDGYRTSDSIVIIPLSTSPEDISGEEVSHRKIASISPEGISGPTSLEPSVEPSAAAARGKSDLEALSVKLIEAVGDGNIQGHGALVIGPIIGLIEAGCDLETDILPTIRAVSARLKRPAGSWTYFVPAIREAHEARIAAGRRVVKPSTPEATEKRWQTRLTMARQKGQWASADWGPAPGKAGCLAPEHLLQPSDGMGWREWQSEAA